MIKKLLHDIFLRLYLKFAIIDDFDTIYCSVAKGYNEEERLLRKQFVENYIFSKFSGPTVCKDGEWNYFPLPSGRSLVIDYVLPSVPLYVIVAGIESASWDEARKRGIDKHEWENYNLDLKVLEEDLPKLVSFAVPRVLIVRWQDPLTQTFLDESLGK